MKSQGSHIRKQGLITKKCIATHTNKLLNLHLQCLINEKF